VPVASYRSISKGVDSPAWAGVTLAIPRVVERRKDCAAADFRCFHVVEKTPLFCAMA
jgi:hypothetical protein